MSLRQLAASVAIMACGLHIIAAPSVAEINPDQIVAKAGPVKATSAADVNVTVPVEAEWAVGR